MKPLWKVKDSFNRTSWKVSDVQIVHYTWVLSVSVSLCLCVSVSLCLCVSVSLCVVVVEEGERGGDKPNHVPTDSLRSVPQDC